MAKEDIQEATALIIASFKNNPFRAIVFPTVGQATMEQIEKKRQSAIDDSDQHALKVVDTDNNDKMAGCAVWQHTKEMTDEDWEQARKEEPHAYPEARQDILAEFLLKHHESKRRIMGHKRWWGESTPALHVAFRYSF